MQTWRRVDFIIIALLSIALGFLVVDYLNRDTGATGTVSGLATEDSRPSVAVLPLVNMSSDTENEHFADCLTEEVLNVLAQNQNLLVAGRTSSFFYKGKNENLQTIGDALNVNHILEGSVRKAGNTIRVTVQLISVGVRVEWHLLKRKALN